MTPSDDDRTQRHQRALAHALRQHAAAVGDVVGEGGDDEAERVERLVASRPSRRTPGASTRPAAASRRGSVQQAGGEHRRERTGSVAAEAEPGLRGRTLAAPPANVAATGRHGHTGSAQRAASRTPASGSASQGRHRPPRRQRCAAQTRRWTHESGAMCRGVARRARRRRPVAIAPAQQAAPGRRLPVADRRVGLVADAPARGEQPPDQVDVLAHPQGRIEQAVAGPATSANRSAPHEQRGSGHVGHAPVRDALRAGCGPRSRLRCGRAVNRPDRRSAASGHNARCGGGNSGVRQKCAASVADPVAGPERCRCRERRRDRYRRRRSRRCAPAPGPRSLAAGAVARRRRSATSRTASGSFDASSTTITG